MHQGFGELRLPADLLRKLRHDFERMKMSPQDQYAAFDFFVTAEHIIDCTQELCVLNYACSGFQIIIFSIVSRRPSVVPCPN